jgi:hypothetical protein
MVAQVDRVVGMNQRRLRREVDNGTEHDCDILIVSSQWRGILTSSHTLLRRFESLRDVRGKDRRDQMVLGDQEMSSLDLSDVTVTILIFNFLSEDHFDDMQDREAKESQGRRNLRGMAIEKEEEGEEENKQDVNSGGGRGIRKE